MRILKSRLGTKRDCLSNQSRVTKLQFSYHSTELISWFRSSKFCHFHDESNLFAKIHRTVLRKIIIDLLYFWDVYDVNLLKKENSAEVRHIHAEQISLYNFIVLRKNNRHSWRLNKSSKTFKINRNLWVFLNCNTVC